MTQSVFTADALAGEIVLVTGASRGIGAAILDVCVKAGATVIGRLRFRYRVSEQRRHHSRYAFHAYERFSVG